ncbi:hypothetical protein BGZ89_009415, partial [Linnemannia elongata]
MSMETHPNSLGSPPDDAQATATLRSTAPQVSTNSAFASIGRAANRAVQPSSTAKNQSIGHGVAAIVVKSVMVPSDRASDDVNGDADNKSASFQPVRKRDKIFNLFRPSSSERKIKQAQSTSSKAAANQLSTASTKTALNHLTTDSTQYSGDKEHEVSGITNTDNAVSRSVDIEDAVGIEHAVSTTKVKSRVADVQPPALPSKPTVAVFSQNVDAPVVFITLPEFGSRIDTTPQLALCIGLLANGSDLINQAEHSPQDLSSGTAAQLAWIKSMKQDPLEQERLRWLGARMVDEFAKDASKDSIEIAEMVLVGPVLDREHYRRLLTCTITAFDQAMLLDVDLLQGLVQLVQSAPSESLLPDDLVKILRVLR